MYRITGHYPMRPLRADARAGRDDQRDHSLCMPLTVRRAEYPLDTIYKPSYPLITTITK